MTTRYYPGEVILSIGAISIGLRRISVLRNVYGDYHMTMAECNEGGVVVWVWTRCGCGSGHGAGLAERSGQGYAWK